jgi:hypothetical protein
MAVGFSSTLAGPIGGIVAAGVGGARGGFSGAVDGLKMTFLPHRQLQALGVPQANKYLRYAEPSKWYGQLKTRDSQPRAIAKAQNRAVAQAEDEELSRSRVAAGTGTNTDLINENGSLADLGLGTTI